MTRGATYEIAEWLAGLRDHDVPDATREAVRCAVLDTLGCGVYGHTTAWARATREWASRGSAGWASIWSPGGRGLRPADAALANGVAAHAFELDDYHHAKIHPGAAVIPAALALGEQVETSGMALFTAIVAGYEVMIRAALALDPVSARLRGWHLTGVTGPLGAAAAAASLLRLDAERTAWALGLAGTQGAGLFAFNACQRPPKQSHPGSPIEGQCSTVTGLLDVGYGFMASLVGPAISTK
jgi:2-methylcitrate dehydratase PrpD